MSGKKTIVGILGLSAIIGIFGGGHLFGFYTEKNNHEETLTLQARVDAVLANQEPPTPAILPTNANYTTKKAASTNTISAVPPNRTHQLQFNPSLLAEWVHEDVFIDYLKVKGYPEDFRWIFAFKDKTLNTKEAEAAGYINPVTGDPIKIPRGLVELQGPVMLFGYSQFPEWYAGDWVLTWDGIADANIWHDKVQVISSKRVGDGGRMVFKMPASGASPQRARFSNIRTPLKNLKLTRARDEKAAQNGQIWNPDFINYASRYDIIRTMVLQDMNNNPARRFADIATPQDPHFVHREIASNERQRPRYDRYGVPYEYLFDLAAETKSALWLHLPIQIGSKLHQSDVQGNTNKIFDNAKANARSILTSPEWEIFATEFKNRLLASNYPKDQALYIELGNEVWNMAWPFAIASRYAEGIAKAYDPGRSVRYGYGILSAKMILSLEAALEGSGYQPTYVIAGQTASPFTTKSAYEGLSTYLQQNNINPASIISKTGVALTNYHGGADAYQKIVSPRPGETLVQAWEREINSNGASLKLKLRDHYINGDRNALYGKAWLLYHWDFHQKLAREFGAQIIGAYEGGSHDTPPQDLAQSEIFNQWWTDYHWGTEGADVVRQINLALIRKYPGLILSDFTTMGQIGIYHSPWYDGHYSNKTEMMEMWEEFQRNE